MFQGDDAEYNRNNGCRNTTRDTTTERNVNCFEKLSKRKQRRSTQDDIYLVHRVEKLRRETTIAHRKLRNICNRTIGKNRRYGNNAANATNSANVSSTNSTPGVLAKPIGGCPNSSSAPFQITFRRNLENSFIMDMFANCLIFYVPAKLIQTVLELVPFFSCESKLFIYGALAVFINETKPKFNNYEEKLDWLLTLMIVTKMLSMLKSFLKRR